MYWFQRAKTPVLHRNKSQAAKLFLTLTSLLVCSTVLSLFGGAGTAHAATMHASNAHIANCSGFDSFGAGSVWEPGDSNGISSCGGASIQLIYQNDGNFVLYIGGSAKWATGTNIHSWQVGFTPAYAEFDSNGQLAVYDNETFPVPHVAQVWNSGTYGEGGTNMDLQMDGNLVI